MGWASRLNPESSDNRKRPSVAAVVPPREYQPGDLQDGDVVTLGTSPTRFRVSEQEDGVIAITPIGRY